MSENSYLQVLYSIFPSENIVTSQPLGAAFRNFVHVFRSYYRAKWKINQEKRVKTRTSSLFSSEIDVTYICFGQGRKYGPCTQGPISTFATRDLVAKVDIGPRVHGPPFLPSTQSPFIIYQEQPWPPLTKPPRRQLGPTTMTSTYQLRQ